ncbi:hypothetical protein FGM00_03855 [Aggregatimonas sangjinii]|uniref:Lipoprotein n=1 Tax=Aggregatimonas sangjinii TaxID=2583587 RepID=A0A5B7SQL4_9FLAO|nr:hypothetical protein [Aggregatimonas sangjinii]QCW99287.1 hypothetical protein FGM00_03855 [Aggregatimonas sangjinii]
MKKSLQLTITTILFSTFIGCSVAEDVKDTLDAAECATLIERLDNDVDNNESCSEIRADVNSILSGSCRDFITEEQRTQLEFIRDNCSDE